VFCLVFDCLALDTNWIVRPFIEMSELLPVLEAAFIAEWPEYFSIEFPGRAREELLAYLEGEDLPLAWVALTETGQLAGTAAIKTKAFGSVKGYSPWLAAGLTLPGFRKKGVASALIRHIEQEATLMGIPFLFVVTETANSIVEQNGWELFDTIESAGVDAPIYRKALHN